MNHITIAPNLVFATYSMIDSNQRILDTLTTRVTNKKGTVTLSLEEYERWEFALLTLSKKPFELSGKTSFFIKKIVVTDKDATITLDKSLVPMARTKLTYPVAWADMLNDNNIKRLFERLYLHDKKGYYEIDVVELFSWLNRKDNSSSERWLLEAIKTINNIGWKQVLWEHKDSRFIFMWDKKKTPARLTSKTLVKQPKATQKHLARQLERLTEQDTPQDSTPAPPSPTKKTRATAKMAKKIDTTLISYQLCDSQVYKQSHRYRYGVSPTQARLQQASQITIKDKQVMLMNKMERLLNQFERLMGQVTPPEVVQTMTAPTPQAPVSQPFSFAYDANQVGQGTSRRKGRKRQDSSEMTMSHANMSHAPISTPVFGRNSTEMTMPSTPKKRSELPDIIHDIDDDQYPTLDVFTAFNLLKKELAGVQRTLNEFAPIARNVYFACKAEQMSDTTFLNELHKRLELKYRRKEEISKADGYNLDEHDYTQLECVLAYYRQIYLGDAKTVGDFSIEDVQKPYCMAYFMTKTADRICEHKQLENEGIMTFMHRANVWQQSYKEGWYYVESLHESQRRLKDDEVMARLQQAEAQREEEARLKKEKEHELALKGRQHTAQWLCYESSAIALFDELYKMQKSQVMQIIKNVIDNPQKDIISMMTEDSFGNMLGFALARQQQQIEQGIKPTTKPFDVVATSLAHVIETWEKARQEETPIMLELSHFKRHKDWEKRIKDIQNDGTQTENRAVDVVDDTLFKVPVLMRQNEQEEQECHIKIEGDTIITYSSDLPPVTSDIVTQTFNPHKHYDGVTDYNTGFGIQEAMQTGVMHSKIDMWGNQVADIDGRDLPDDDLTALLDPY